MFRLKSLAQFTGRSSSALVLSRCSLPITKLRLIHSFARRSVPEHSHKVIPLWWAPPSSRPNKTVPSLLPFPNNNNKKNSIPHTHAKWFLLLISLCSPMSLALHPAHAPDRLPSHARAHSFCSFALTRSLADVFANSSPKFDWSRRLIVAAHQHNPTLPPLRLRAGYLCVCVSEWASAARSLMLFLLEWVTKS